MSIEYNSILDYVIIFCPKSGNKSMRIIRSKTFNNIEVVTFIN